MTEGIKRPAEGLENSADFERRLKLSMYADGELPAEEVEEFERELLSSPELQAELEEIEVLKALASSEVPQPSPRQTWIRAWRPIRIGAALATAAAVALIFVGEGSRKPFEFSVEQRDGPRFRSQGAKPGDQLSMSGKAARGWYPALRIYRWGSEKPALACPEDPSCRVSGTKIEATLELKRGEYLILWIESPNPVAPPQGDTERDVAALAAKALTTFHSLEVN